LQVFYQRAWTTGVNYSSADQHPREIIGYQDSPVTEVLIGHCLRQDTQCQGQAAAASFRQILLCSEDCS
jgi:hypothetical protein